MVTLFSPYQRTIQNHISRAVSFSRAMKSNLGQAQVMVAIFFILLLPTTVILAQNASIFNNSLEGDIIADPTFQETIDIPFELNIEELIEQAVPAETSENKSTEATSSDTRHQNTTDPVENTTTNEEIILEIPPLPLPEREENTPGTQETIEIEVPLTLPQEPPELTIEIKTPEQITRGETTSLSVVITNRGKGPAENVRVDIELPDFFDIVTGDSDKTCGKITPGSFCTQELEVIAPLDAVLGKDSIQVKVRYEN